MQKPWSTKKIFLLVLLAIIVLAPRVALLFNGLDSQRIWDTNTPAAFRFLQAAEEHHLRAFYEDGQKYPLLGSYTFVPVVGAYYLAERLTNQFHSAADFVNAYVLGDTNLFFWIRLEMLIMNVATLWLLYKTIATFTPGKRAGWYGLLFALVNFYVTLFSVAPRIHNFAWFGVTLTLYLSARLLAKKTTARYAWAFGAAAMVGSMSQSGLTALILPVMAHCYDADSKTWSLRLNRKVILALIGWLLFTVVVGYPRTLLWMIDQSVHLFANVVLGSNHILPRFEFTGVPFIYLVSSEFITLWLGICFVWRTWLVKAREQYRLEPYDYLALSHVIVFFGIFGFSSVFSGRFMLAVMPSLFFLLARFLVRFERRRSIMYPLIIIVLFQAFGIVQLTRIAMAKDTRVEAAEFVLAHSAPTDRIVTSIDPVLLGIIPRPESIRHHQISVLGVDDTTIASRGLIGKKSRDLTLWVASSTTLDTATIQSFRFAVIAWSEPEAPMVEAQLLQNNFHVVKTIFATRRPERERPFIPWDLITPIPRWPLPYVLAGFRAFGPTITIYERS